MPSGTRAAKNAKRRTVAAGVLAGADTARIAREAGCRMRYAQKLANDPEVQYLITAALAPHRARLTKLAQRAVYAVETALLAKKTDKADHLARMRAVERYGDLLGLAQGKAQPPAAADGQVTWEQFTLMYQRRTAANETP